MTSEREKIGDMLTWYLRDDASHLENAYPCVARHLCEAAAEIESLRKEVDRYAGIAGEYVDENVRLHKACRAMAREIERMKKLVEHLHAVAGYPPIMLNDDGELWEGKSETLYYAKGRIDAEEEH